MAKDNRKILSAVRLHADRETGTGRTVFRDGMENELAEAASQEQLDGLVKSGALSGDWKAIKKAKAKEEK
jgi:hypothetical protein